MTAVGDGDLDTISIEVNHSIHLCKRARDSTGEDKQKERVSLGPPDPFEQPTTVQDKGICCTVSLTTIGTPGIMRWARYFAPHLLK